MGVGIAARLQLSTRGQALHISSRVGEGIAPESGVGIATCGQLECAEMADCAEGPRLLLASLI